MNRLYLWIFGFLYPCAKYYFCCVLFVLFYCYVCCLNDGVVYNWYHYNYFVCDILIIKITLFSSRSPAVQVTCVNTAQNNHYNLYIYYTTKTVTHQQSHPSPGLQTPWSQRISLLYSCLIIRDSVDKIGLIAISSSYLHYFY